MTMKILATAAISLALIAGPANAATMLFNVTGTDSATFSLDSSSPFATIHLNGNPTLDYDQFSNVPAILNGVSKLAEISFYDAASGGGFQITIPGTYISPLGAVVFQGTLANPVFAPGTFSFSQDFTRGAIKDQLVISDAVTSAVPEPVTWLMMLAGFFGIGIVLRRKQQVVAAFAPT